MRSTGLFFLPSPRPESEIQSTPAYFHQQTPGTTKIILHPPTALFPQQIFQLPSCSACTDFFFLKHSGAPGSHVRFRTPTLTGLNADETVRVISERAILQHSHHHTHTRTQYPGGNPESSGARTQTGGLHTWSAHRPS